MSTDNGDTRPLRLYCTTVTYTVFHMAEDVADAVRSAPECAAEEDDAQAECSPDDLFEAVDRMVAKGKAELPHWQDDGTMCRPWNVPQDDVDEDKFVTELLVERHIILCGLRDKVVAHFRSGLVPLHWTTVADQVVKQAREDGLAINATNIAYVAHCTLLIFEREAETKRKWSEDKKTKIGASGFSPEEQESWSKFWGPNLKFIKYVNTALALSSAGG